MASTDPGASASAVRAAAANHRPQWKPSASAAMQRGDGRTEPAEALRQLGRQQALARRPPTAAWLPNGWSRRAAS